VSSRDVPEQELRENSTHLATRSSYPIAGCSVSRREMLGRDYEGHGIWSCVRLAGVITSGEEDVVTEIECQLRGEIHGVYRTLASNRRSIPGQVERSCEQEDGG
jgi:hypothetical protein